MKESPRHRIQIKNRTALQDVIPLETPFVVYLDPSSACNLRCKFCPTGERDEIRKTTRWMGTMNFDLYKKVVNDLIQFNAPIKALKLYKDGEPLLNKHFAEMISYAKKSGSVKCIETTTNGTLLTPELIEKIIVAGLDRINISVYGMSSNDFMKFTRTQVNFDEYVRNIAYLYNNRGACHIHIKTNLGISDTDVVDTFFQTFKPYCDSINIENISPFWPGYNFHEKYDLQISTNAGTFGQKLENKLVCPYVFYALAVNSDGRVDLCSCDWTHDYTIGDIGKQSLKEIWNSKALYDEQIFQLSGLRMKHPLCSQCFEITYESVDNIDNYCDELLERLQRRSGIQTAP